MITPTLDHRCRELFRTAASGYHIRGLENMRTNILAHVSLGLSQPEVDW